MDIWKAVEDTPAGKQILLAFTLALRGTSIPDIARHTGLPKSSLYSIRRNEAFAHRRQERSRFVTAKQKSPDASPGHC